jgi:hypothetical protein
VARAHFRVTDLFQGYAVSDNYLAGSVPGTLIATTGLFLHIA